MRDEEKIKPIYDMFDFQELCPACKRNIEQKYKYCCRTDRFYENQIEELRKGYWKLLEFVKEIAADQSRIFVDLDDRAKDLLKEIGEL